MICLNAVWMGIEIDHSDAATMIEADLGFQVVANAFCALFLVEFLIRVFAFRNIRNAVREFWIMFDAFLVFLMVLETWIVSLFVVAFGWNTGTDATANLKALVVFRILRLLRVLRLARVLRELNELMVIVRAMAIAFRAISVVLILLGLIVYMGAISFTVLLEDTSVGRNHFRSVTMSMATLLLEMTLSGARGGPLIKEASQDSLVYSALLLLFVLLANITVMGVLGGLLVQTVKTVAELEKEERQVKSMARMLDDLWGVLHEDDDSHIREVHLQKLLTDPNAAKALQVNGVDLDGLVDTAHFTFEQHDGTLSKPEFKRMVLDLRGKNAAKVKDHVETRRFMCGVLKRVVRGSMLVQ